MIKVMKKMWKKLPRKEKVGYIALLTVALYVTVCFVNVASHNTVEVMYKYPWWNILKMLG